jgi:hypothetical protein
MKRDPIAVGWKSFEALVIPASAGKQQRIDMKGAFYAGASTIFLLLVNGISPGTGEPTEADFALLDAIRREVDEFGQYLDREILSRHSRGDA